MSKSAYWINVACAFLFGCISAYSYLGSALVNADVRAVGGTSGNGNELYCNAYSTVDKTCGNVGNNKCTKTHTICLSVQENGTKTIRCHDNGGEQNANCKNDPANCTADNDASIDNTPCLQN